MELCISVLVTFTWFYLSHKEEVILQSILSSSQKMDGNFQALYK